MGVERQWLRLEPSSAARHVGSIVLVLILANMVAVGAQTNTTNSGEIVSDGTNKPRPIDEGLKPLYIMTKVFLENVVQPQTFQSLNIDIVKLQKGQINWQEWTSYFVGFVICIIIGILFIIIMPIVGFCFCCCRCCGNCGGRASVNDPKGAKCKRVTCGGVLLIITTFMLAGVICAFMTNELIQEQTGDNNGLLPTIRNNLAAIDKYKDDTVKELTKVISKSLKEGKTEIMDTLQELPDKAVDELGRITNASSLLNSAESLADSITDMRNALGNVTSTVEDLRTSNTQLSQRLDAVSNNTAEAIKSCFSNECNQIRNKLNLISTNSDFTKVDDVKDELNQIQGIYNENLPKLIRQGKDSFQNITKKMRSDAAAEIKKADDEMEDVIKKVNQSAYKLIDQLNQYNLAGIRRDIGQLEPKVREYGQYTWYGGIALSCVILLIALMNCLGLMFGACGERPYDDATICNKGVGAKLFMAGVGFTFIFSWALMLVTTIMFAVFGIFHTEVCRYLIPPESITSTTFLDNILNQTLRGQVDMSINISATIRDCKNNQPIYKALNLDTIINLKQKVNLTQFDLDSLKKSILDSVGQIPDVTVISPEALTQLENLENAGLEKINFTSYSIQLDKHLTETNLTTFSLELESLAQTLNQSGNAAVVADLEQQAKELQDIQSTLVANMTVQKDKLKADITALQSLIHEGDAKFNEKVKALVKSLNDTQNMLRGNGTALLKQVLETTLNAFVKSTEDTVYGLIDKMTNSVGKCQPLYEATTGILNGVCVTFLYPVNGFWFALGWCLFFFIPSIIVAVKLAGWYRKTEPYDPYAFNKAFDDPYHRNYDAYQGVYPGDNIPLEEVDNQKNYRNGHQGVQNRGFESGDYRGGQPSYHRNGAGSSQLSRGYGGGGEGTSRSDAGIHRDSGAGEGYHPQTTSSQSPSNPPYHYNTRPQYY